MITKAYSLFDIKAQHYMTPFFTINDGTAIRSLSQMVNEKEPNMVNQYPDDYNLFCVGSFDDSTGVLSPIDHPRSLGLAAQFKV